MTDGKTEVWGGSKQNLQEWKTYKEVLDESGITNGDIPWLDIRGNHDNFNIISINSSDNFHLNYSIQGQKRPRSFIHQMTVRSMNYSFIAVDACMTPGPKRPFDFFGHLDKAEIQHVTELIKKSKESNSNYNIWFGHFPTSCILTDGEKDIKQIIGDDEKSMAYLCGHLHTFAGLSPNMYTIQNQGYLEIEISDWKEHRIFRLGVIDNGLFTFIDIKHDDWPIGIITNPKNSQYYMKKKENIQSIIDSTHIRVLAFSLDPIVNVSIQINNEKWINCFKINDDNDPLWITPWNSSLYKNGNHFINAKIIDKMGRIKITDKQLFSFDGKKPTFTFTSTILLNTESNLFFKITIFFYILLSIIIIVPLCFFKYFHYLCQTKQMNEPRIRRKFIRYFVRKLWLLSTIDFIFYPIVIYPFYLAIGPWIAGEIIEDKFGVIYAWGIFVGQKFIPTSLAYFYGFLQLLTFHLPLVFILAHTVDRRYQWLHKIHQEKPKKLLFIWRNLLFIILMIIQIYFIIILWLAYGTVATLLCPLLTWSTIMAIILWYYAHQVSISCIKCAGSVWTPS